MVSLAVLACGCRGRQRLAGSSQHKLAPATHRVLQMQGQDRSDTSGEHVLAICHAAAIKPTLRAMQSQAYTSAGVCFLTLLKAAAVKQPSIQPCHLTLHTVKDLSSPVLCMQGPDHSSARVARFLALCNDNADHLPGNGPGIRRQIEKAFNALVPPGEAAA